MIGGLPPISYDHLLRRPRWGRRLLVFPFATPSNGVEKPYAKVDGQPYQKLKELAPQFNAAMG